jgi:hypothetical protein
MTKPIAGSREIDLVRGLAVVIVAAVGVRLVNAVAAGISELAQSHDDFPNTWIDRGQTLLNFGSAGDGVDVLLCLTAAALVWWLLRADEPAERLRSATAAVFVLVALSALTSAVGYVFFAVGPGEVQWYAQFRGTGDSLVYMALAIAGYVTTRRLAFLPGAAGEAFADDGDPLVFAVDRQSGDVRAYFSVDEAARRTHVYSVEDDEYAFYTDEGDVIAVTIEQDRVMMRPTDANGRDELLERLKEFVVRRDIHVDVLDADDPTAYAGPISDWQWLQLWPGWLRWMGRLLRRR